ncbi:type I restriction endonuclease subunit R, EcoR124 family [Propionibacteriaceae bacterium Y1923]
MSPRDLQNYASIFNGLWEKHRKSEKKVKESILDDVVFEIELVKQVELNIDYILMLGHEVARGEGSRHRTRRPGHGDPRCRRGRSNPPTAGTAITRILPPASRFSKDNGSVRQTV